MLRIANPYFKPAAQAAREAKAAQHAPAIDAWLRTQTSNRTITLAELKAALPAAAPDLDRQTVNMIATLLGLVIENPEDTEA